MIQENYAIRFAFLLDGGNVAVPLTAKVETGPDRKQYLIKDLRNFHSPTHDVLPDMLIKKVKSQWVYSDSSRSNELTFVIGRTQVF
jgi:hypothetical protein